MGHTIIFEDNQIIDIDSTKGCYEHVSRFLIQHGAPSIYFSSLETLFKQAQDKHETLLHREHLKQKKTSQSVRNL